ncbi:MAG: helix-turn-helix transcriptional regulator [Clostridia bacterium]|nr:helix-turn-helix transcriptional regulator [Clostridia bacterium]MBQ8574524.1 helix-turn-helix transcriptional regulator [Clostridia bacterium]
MISERIKELRLAMNYSQVELASKLSVTKQTVSNWENDNIQPSIDVLIKLSNFFGVSTDYLLGRDDIPRLDVSGLSNQEISHINMIISDIKNNHSI